jgi:hypothetical protein
MASLQVRINREETTENGQILGLAEWLGSTALMRVKGCVCSDGEIRTAYVTGGGATFGSLPARVGSVEGYLYYCEGQGLYKFTEGN